jgi:hypothetical protein
MLSLHPSKGGLGMLVVELQVIFGPIHPASTLPWRDWMNYWENELRTVRINAIAVKSARLQVMSNQFAEVVF